MNKKASNAVNVAAELLNDLDMLPDDNQREAERILLKLIEVLTDCKAVTEAFRRAELNF